MISKAITNQTQFFLLAIILLIGASLRAYNLDFPSIGYHNMNENEYLGIAQEMEKTGDFLTKRVYFYNDLKGSPGIKNDPQPALVPYQTLAAWNLLGKNVWAPRLVNCVFGVLSILIIYFIGYAFFNNFSLALSSAFLLAIMPLGVFFSRNIQPESPAFFFLSLGTLFYLRFINSFKKYNLILAGIGITLSWAYEFKFLIGALPLLLCLPFKTIIKEKKGFLGFLICLFLPYALIAAYILWFRTTGQGAFSFNFRPYEIFTPRYWQDHGSMISWYLTGENFTFIYSLLAACGICLAFFKNSGLISRYLIAGSLSIFVYAILFPDVLYQNSYSHIPFLGMVCLSCVYAINFLSQEIQRLFKLKFYIYAYIFALLASLSLSPIRQSITRMFETVFLGQDVAGESLKEFTPENERIFLLTHSQGYAIARYAHRYVVTASGLNEFKENEKKYAIRFVCIYPTQYLDVLKQNNPEFYGYIEKNFKIKEVGFLENQNSAGYLILEKTQADDKNTLGFTPTISGRMLPKAIYKLAGKLIFFYTIRP